MSSANNAGLVSTQPASDQVPNFTKTFHELLSEPTITIRSFFTTLSTLMWQSFRECSTMTQFSISIILTSFFVALVQDPSFLGTPREWCVGLFSFTCVGAIIFLIVQFNMQRELREEYRLAQKPLGDVECLKLMVQEVNGAGKLKQAHLTPIQQEAQQEINIPPTPLLPAAFRRRRDGEHPSGLLGASPRYGGGF
ncbi:hypothetical protein N0V90_002234 [Kalmusia sp. IMI 367209]|nr:hypothetical protein N0V90_002234 [Kalmusia sp. IMI 367209]